MKNLIKLAGMLVLVLGLNSCKDNANRTKYFKEYLSSAIAYNYLEKEEKALEYLDSLQNGIIREYSKKLTKENLAELSEIYSRACLERGRIYKERGNLELAIKAFEEAIVSYFGYDVKISSTWDPVLEAYIEMADTYEKMGNKEKAEEYKKIINLLAN